MNVFDPVVYNANAEKVKDNAELQFYMQVKRVSTNGGLAVATASGTVLGNCEVNSVADILKKWQALPEEERRPGAVKVPPLPPDAPRAQSPNPVPPGALVLKVFLRPVERKADGDIAARPLNSLVCGWASHDVPREGAWIMEPEWQALVPSAAKKGEVRPVPPSLRDRLVRFHLADWYRYGKPWLPQEVRTSEMFTVVEDVSDRAIRLRLEGKVLIANAAKVAEATRGHDGRFHGRLTFDRVKKSFSRFDLVEVGDAWWTDTPNAAPGILGKNLGRHTIGMAFELAPAGTGFARLPPRYLGGDGGDRGYRTWHKEYLAVDTADK
jgi:hypothetical protein